MSDTIPNQDNPEYIPRLRFLKVLCIMTFIGSGLGLFSYGMIGLFYELFSKTPLNALGEEQQDVIKMLLSGSRNFFLLNAFFYLGSLWGAYYMFHLRRIGFHFYALSQIFILILPLLFITGFQLPWMTITITVMFIFAYAGFLRIMK